VRLSEAEFSLICQKQKNKKTASPKESEIQKILSFILSGMAGMW